MLSNAWFLEVHSFSPKCWRWVSSSGCSLMCQICFNATFHLPRCWKKEPRRCNACHPLCWSFKLNTTYKEKRWELNAAARKCLIWPRSEVEVINHRQPRLLRFFDHADTESELLIHLAELMARIYYTQRAACTCSGFSCKDSVSSA